MLTAVHATKASGDLLGELLCRVPGNQECHAVVVESVWNRRFQNTVHNNL